MASRKYPIVAGEIYHVFNRTNAKEPIFLSSKDYQRAIDVFSFYQYGKISLRFSHFNRLTTEEKSKFLDRLSTFKPIIEILCFAIMPNHFHFLLKNVTERGISNFMRYFQNSLAKYFNLKKERTGSLFQQNFKAVRIETDEQLTHVSRYIHLNPVTAYIIKDVTELENYPWTSYPEYISKTKSCINKKILLDYFKSVNSYKKFITDQINYQRELERMRHLILD